ncbi:MAG: enoyl-CoA hydratase/isomerase family protein [Rhizobiaceae bacterium]|nr:enoyl-CoA hydratase/isomerase family protein [Rhizobiaceae bacterium]
MAADEILFERSGTTGWIVLNRPEARNALTHEMYDRLAEYVSNPAIGGPDGVRAIVVTGAGDKAFAAGTAIESFRAVETPEHALAYEDKMDRVLGAVEACPVPTIAAMQGASTGGGAAIATACDLRIATADLRFGFPIARTLGNCLSVANLSRLSALVGAGRTKEMLLTARLVGGEEAEAIGLVAEILPDVASLHQRAAELAVMLASHAPITMRATKEALRRLRIDGAAADDRDLIVEAYTSADFKEGIEAFLGKRTPRWTGR